MTPPPNYAASAHERLKNLAAQRKVDFNRLVERYVVERFLYRLGMSSEVDRFTLKGAALLVAWAGKELRTTRDVDFLAFGDASHAAIRRSIEAVCAVDCMEDGVVFDASTIETSDIRPDEEYHGVRVRLRALLGTGVVPLQIDIGFGDAITPERRESDYPTLLAHPAPRLWIYPREAAIAEKFEAMVKLGVGNSRMKDFWDVAVLALEFDFDGETLRAAIDETFRRRGTVLDQRLPDALTPTFYQAPTRLGLWQGFQGRAGILIDAPTRFDEVGEIITRFLGPIRMSIVQREPFTQVWPARGPWRTGATRVGREERNG